MYDLIHSRTVSELLYRQGPTLIASLFISEVFYKFHSFTVEAIAFLATWYVLGAAIHLMGRLWNALVRRAEISAKP